MPPQDTDTRTGLANLRDCGGLPVPGTGGIRHGLLFRSGSLTRLSAADRAYLDGLGLKANVDLRTRAEQRNHPAEWNPADIHHVRSEIPDIEGLMAELVGSTESTNWSDRFSAFYARLPEIYASELRAVLALLADGEVPILINCSAGKDRTGVAVALVLSIAGVPRDAIIDEYLLSRERIQRNAAFMQMLTGKILKNFADLPEEARRVMLDVDARHIDSAFSAIATHYGSIDGYTAKRLGISDKQRQAIRDNLTRTA